MQKNNRFDQPRHQSYWAIILIIFKLYKTWFKQLMPVLIGIWVGSKKASTLLYSILAFFVLVAIFGLVYFFRYTFYLSDNELVINKGVFRKSKMNIPFDRIQSINFQQSILHQIFSVVKLEVDTAGSAGVEFDLRAISRKDAVALREIILAGKSQTPEDSKIESENKPDIVTPQEQLLFKLTFPELVKVGLTQNHLKSGMLPFLLYFWLRSTLGQGGVELDKYMDKYADPEQVIKAGLLVIAVLIFGYALLAMLISLILSIFRFYDLSFYRKADGFKVKYGLFTKREISTKDTKIQIFRWQDNLLRKIPKIFDLQIKQAASAAVKKKTSILHIAGVSAWHIHRFLEAYFPQGDYVVDAFIPISKWWFKRQTVIMAIVLVLTGGLFYFFPNPPVFIGLVLLYGLQLLGKYLFSQKSKIGFNDEVLQIKSGHFGDTTELVQLHKIQGVKLEKSPFQRRKNLATIVIFTAAGNIKSPYLPIQKAETIRDYILFKIETDTRSWM